MKKPWEYVYVIRPIEPIENCLRYADGKWIEDDGNPDLAFIGRHEKGFPIAVYVEIPYKNILWQWGSIQIWHYMFDGHVEKWLENRDNHPNVIAGEKAMEKCTELYGVANGTPVPIYMMNPWIEKGKLWRIEDDGRLTLVKPPEKIECTLCVKHLHELHSLQEKVAKIRNEIKKHQQVIEICQSRIKDLQKQLEETEKEIQEWKKRYGEAEKDEA